MTRQWQKSHSGEFDELLDGDQIIATFFIPLPEFLRFSDTQTFPQYRRIDYETSSWLRTFEDVPHRTDAERNDPTYISLVDAVLLVSSVVFRRHPIALEDASDLRLIETMFETFTPMEPRVGDTSETEQATNYYFTSIAEVGVSLDSVALDLTTSERREPFRIRNKNDVSGEIINKALDVALEAIRFLQLGYYGSTREPVTLVEREMLPPVSLVSLRTVHELMDQAKPEPQTFLTGNLPSQFGVANDLSEEEMSKVRKLLSTTSPLTRYLDLYRQGAVALRLGKTRECLVMMAVAAESLINVLLAHLQWEECLTPEASAATWAPSLDTRIKTVLPPKLGGNWDTTRPGVIRDWNENIAAIRHRVVHAGYKPTVEQARKAIDSLNALVTFLGDRVVHSGNLRKYPRTALTLLAPEGLKRRDRYTRAVREIERDRSEVNWGETFSRWYDTQNLCLQDEKNPRQPGLSRSTYYIVFTSKTEHFWVASDWEARKAAKVTVTLAQGAVNPVQQPLRKIESMQEGATAFPISAQVVDGVVDAAELEGEWLESYHLMPLYGVMRDKSDFSR